MFLGVWRKTNLVLEDILGQKEACLKKKTTKKKKKTQKPKTENMHKETMQNLRLAWAYKSIP